MLETKSICRQNLFEFVSCFPLKHLRSQLIEILDLFKEQILNTDLRKTYKGNLTLNFL